MFYTQLIRITLATHVLPRLLAHVLAITKKKNNKIHHITYILLQFYYTYTIIIFYIKLLQ